ncbi:MAG: sigma 54-dependent Fis family transcriptional regulator [Planctomycetes bacterium]|nr:sigma 54-dependent Fis family transcriptional regulator [Planctomycetota bacterium]
METEAEATQTELRLVIIRDGSIRTVPLLGSRWTIGRAPDCEIQLRDPTVSRRHILLERDPDGDGPHLRFHDLGGRNPILVDGQPRPGGVLVPGQTIAIGLTQIHLEQRHRVRTVLPGGDTVVVTGREVIDHELREGDPDSSATRARRILERIEWTFADLGSLADAAEPLLSLALNLTGRRRGMLGQLLPAGGLEPLATLDFVDRQRAFQVPEPLLQEARKLRQVSLLTIAGGEPSLLVPLGLGPDAVLLLELPQPNATAGQELLRLGDALGKVVWHRLCEVRERLRLREEVQRLRFRGTTAHNAVLASTRLQTARQTLRELASAAEPILLVGEAGTEREDLARYLHAESGDSGPFVSIHVGMLPDWRLERTLFGDEHFGSALAKAGGGTLFIDEIARLPLALQERLASEPRMARLIGTTSRLPASVPIPDRDTRIPPPEGETDDWSTELCELFLTNVVEIPPLREEAGDVVALAELFLSEMGSAPDGSPRLLSERAKRLLAGYPWPGNVRQLRHILEDAAARAGGSQITPKHLPAEIASGSNGTDISGLASLAEIERRHIRATLKRLGGNRARTAQALGIAPSTLYDKLKRYGIDR